MFNPAQAQEIWHESFSIPGKGVHGNNDGSVHSDMSDITSWTLEFSGVELFDSTDYAKTVSTSGGRFEVHDVNGEVIWRSEWINIAKRENISVKLISAETGSGANTSSKYMKSFYVLDGGEEILFHENGENAGNWGTVNAISKGLSGDSIQIVCYLSTHYSVDKVILDEVVVSAEEKIYPPARPGELLLSEILFNPFPDGEDYVEIYNASEREIPVGRLFLASRDKELKLTQIHNLAGRNYVIPPERYMVITKDTCKVFRYFRIKCFDCFQQVSDMPSFNNDDDYVVLLNENLEILDELKYREEMHSLFLADKEGVSLERISFTESTSSPDNWHSASGDAGYGTPGYENSQAQSTLQGKPVVTFEPEAFSPNYDGYNDEYIIRYQLVKPGYAANISIFDSAGRFVQHIAKNEILGTSGEFIWKGKNENGQRQPIGVYVVVVELFNTAGEVFYYKDGVVLTDILN